jgi:hypothetical protein
VVKDLLNCCSHPFFLSFVLISSVIIICHSGPGALFSGAMMAGYALQHGNQPLSLPIPPSRWAEFRIGKWCNLDTTCAADMYQVQGSGMLTTPPPTAARHAGSRRAERGSGRQHEVGLFVTGAALLDKLRTIGAHGGAECL